MRSVVRIRIQSNRAMMLREASKTMDQQESKNLSLPPTRMFDYDIYIYNIYIYIYDVYFAHTSKRKEVQGGAPPVVS